MGKKAVIAACICGIALPIYLFAPGIVSKKRKDSFRGKNYAHRGLFSEDQQIPENSMPAFRKAIENGYGIELDVQFSKDRKVVVFHDDDLKRACGVDKNVCDLDYSELLQLSLFNTDNRIPLFTDVLRLIKGQVPLIVELKTGKTNKELCQSVYEILKEYPGQYCIESFNPLIVSWFRFHAPGVFRGLLTQSKAEFLKGPNIDNKLAFVLGNILLNPLVRPHFIAHRLEKESLPVRIAYAFGSLKFGWTSHSRRNELNADSLIFEHYDPPTTFTRKK